MGVFYLFQYFKTDNPRATMASRETFSWEKKPGENQPDVQIELVKHPFKKMNLVIQSDLFGMVKWPF